MANEASACTAMFSGTTRYREWVGLCRGAGVGGVGGATAIGVAAIDGLGRAANGSGMSPTVAASAGGPMSLDGVTVGTAAVCSGVVTGSDAGCAVGATGSDA